MENTVIGVYDSYTQADNALNELLASGFSRDDARLSSGAGESSSPQARNEHAGESGIGHFFRALFGMEDQPDHHDIYTEALQRGSCVLSVDAHDDEQRERAIEIMNRYNPVDIEERAESWRSQGWTGRAGMAENAPLTGGEYVAGSGVAGTGGGEQPERGGGGPEKQA